MARTQTPSNIGVSVTAPRPSKWLRQIGFGAIALIVLAGIAYGATWIVSRGGENTSTLMAPAIQQPVAWPVPSTGSGQVQQAPVVLASVAPKIVDYKVVWAEVTGFDPFTIPVEEGFYSGETPNEISWSPSDPNSVPAGDAFAWKIFPQLTTRIRGSPVAAARAPDNKNVVLAGFSIIGNGNYILLSVDGEKSWCRLNLLPPVDHPSLNGRDAVALRVAAYNEEIHLYGQDPRPGNHWWKTVVNKSELPCS